jgi:hypothetical protein
MRIQLSSELAMRLALLAVLVSSSASVFAQERFVERAPLPRNPQPHMMQRSGDSRRIAPWATRSVSRFEAGAYIGGGSLKGNDLLATGAASAAGPTTDGTFGTDFAGFRMRMGRVFLAPSADPSCGNSMTRSYRTDGPHVPDVFALRPLRKACLMKREEQKKCTAEKP